VAAWLKSAKLLRGQETNPPPRPTRTFGDFRDHCFNADKRSAISGNKADQKIYRRHSAGPGGMKTKTFARRLSGTG